MKPQQPPTDTGMNRTGIGTAPIESGKTVEGALQGVPSSTGDAMTAAPLRAEYIRAAEPVGLMPPPSSMKGVVKTGAQMLQGHKPTVLLDKLGERAAFERTGARLYEALIVRFDAAPRRADGAGPRREDLAAIHDQELAHLDLVRSAIETLGADPTVQTPCADITAVASMGLLQVVTDPRTTFAQALQAMLTAELTDNDGWALLADLADALGHTKLATQFREALRAEGTHLASVRRWLAAELMADAGVAAVGS